MLILIFSFLRLAIVSTLLGTAASEIFITKKPIEINKIGNEQIVNLLYEGVGVPKGTAQDTWFTEKIASLKNFDTNKIKFVKTEKGEEGLLELLLNVDVNHFFLPFSASLRRKKALTILFSLLYACGACVPVMLSFIFSLILMDILMFLVSIAWTS